MIFTLKKTNIFYIFIFILLFVIAGFRLLGPSNDYENYYKMVVIKDEIILANKEIFFNIIIRINEILFNSNFTCFLLIFAFLGVGTKLYALVKLSQLPLLSIILYFLSYFWLHEYIQIRAGVATGIFLLATKDLSEKNFKSYYIKVFFAILFHWSSVVLIPLYMILKYKSFKFYAILPILSILLYLININIYQMIDLIMTKLNINQIYYKMYAGYQNKINVFNLISISYILIFYLITFLLIKYRYLFTEYEVTLYRIFSIGISIFYITSLFNAPVVSFRLLEYFLVVLIILLPNIVMKFKEKYLVSTIFILYYCIYSFYLFKNVIEFS